MTNNVLNPVAIVLGGTNPHKALIENLKRRGYYTILVDYYENPVAKYVADEHIRESTLDFDKILQISKEKDAKLVISACIDQANVTACFVADKLGLPRPYSFEIALKVTNKALMKTIMLENGISTSRFVIINNLKESDSITINFPVVVKPADSTGSKGVRKANNNEELLKFAKAAFEISRNGKVIIEEFKDGFEVSVDCFVQDNKTEILMLRKKYNFIDHGSSVITSYASIAPANISENAFGKIKEIVGQIVKIFSLANTSLIVQVIVNGDDVSVIEFAPRVGGGLSFQTVKLNTGFDILDATINSYLGIKTEIKYSKPKSVYSANNIYALPSVFGWISGYEKLIEEGIIDKFYLYKTKGMEIGNDLASKDRVGSFITEALNEQDTVKKVRLAFDNLNVFDINGNLIMRKDIHI